MKLTMSSGNEYELVSVDTQRFQLWATEPFPDFTPLPKEEFTGENQYTYNSLVIEKQYYAFRPIKK